jgi:hypothetical protein
VLEEFVRVCGYLSHRIFQNLCNKMCEVGCVSGTSLLFLLYCFSCKRYNRKKDTAVDKEI